MALLSSSVERGWLRIFLKSCLWWRRDETGRRDFFRRKGSENWEREVRKDWERNEAEQAATGRNRRRTVSWEEGRGCHPTGGCHTQTEGLPLFKKKSHNNNNMLLKLLGAELNTFAVPYLHFFRWCWQKNIHMESEALHFSCLFCMGRICGQISENMTDDLKGVAWRYWSQRTNEKKNRTNKCLKRIPLCGYWLFTLWIS